MEKIPELDPNILATNFIENRIEGIVEMGKELIGKTSGQLKLILKKNYSKYLENLTERYTRTSTFFFQEKTYLYDFYIPAGLESDSKVIESANVESIFEYENQIIISGLGGSGKTILLKHLLIDSLIQNENLPIFIELRELNDTRFTLRKTLLEILNNFGLEIEESFLKKALEKNHFILLLDGFDEIDSKMRKDVIKEIEKITREYPKTKIVLTTRPDHSTNDLSSFFTYKISPFTLNQCVQLVKKLPADDQIKSKFISDLKKDLYKKHTTLLSNPLLLSIMLLTYGNSAHIPNKLSVFYGQAYEALFQRHDTRKGGYIRLRKTDLDIQDFARVFSCFCLITYDSRLFKFSHTDALSFLGKCKKITHQSFIESDYIEDLKQSICLIIEDGLFLTFIHRSFQEYFAALFIINAEEKNRLRLVEKYQDYILEDSVFELMYEMDPNFVEFEVILPFIDKLLKDINFKKTIGVTLYRRFIRYFWDEVTLNSQDVFASASKQSGKKTPTFLWIMNNIEKLLDGNIDNIFDNINYGKNTTKLFNEAKKDLQRKNLFRTSTVKINDPYFVELMNSEGRLSKRGLQLLIQLKNEIEQRGMQRKQSLEEILI